MHKHNARLGARRVKLAAVYLSMTLLCLIFAVLLVRSLLALVTWVALGRCLWLFPFLLSEARPQALLETLCCSQQVTHV